MALLQRIAERVMTISAPFLLEVLLNRDPVGASEEEQLITIAETASREAQGRQRDVGDLGSILVKAGDPQVVVPSLLETDNRPRMAVARALIGPGQLNPRWTAENRQFVDRAKPAISRTAETSEFYFVPSSVRK